MSRTSNFSLEIFDCGDPEINNNFTAIDNLLQSVKNVTDNIYSTTVQHAETVIGFSPTTNKTLTVAKNITLTSPDDTSIATLPTGSKYLFGTSSAIVDGPGVLFNDGAGNYSISNRFLPVNLPKYAPETVITNWASGHGWALTTTGTQTDDTNIKYRGTQSLKLTTLGDAGAVITRKSSLSFDATGKMLKIYVNIDNPSNLTEFWIAATSDTWTNFWTWKISADMTQIKNGSVWVPITLPFLNAVVTGNPVRSSIIAIQIRVKDTGSVVSTNLGGFSLVPESLTAGMCTITFDDGWSSQIDQALLKMATVGQRGVMYIIPELVGTAGYSTLAQLQTAQNSYNWDIAAHHQTNLTTIGSVAGVTNIVANVKNYLINNGFKAHNHFAYPNGAYDETIVLPVIQKYFSSARTIANVKAETIPAPDWYRLRVFLVTNTTATGDIAAAVTAAITGKFWLILVFHKIVVSPTVSTEYSIANFGTVIDNIVSQGIAVKTLTDVEKMNI